MRRRRRRLCTILVVFTAAAVYFFLTRIRYGTLQRNGKCVSILTGYPRADRHRYVVRLIDQLKSHVIGVNGYDIHVFCDGYCGTLEVTFQRVVFHSLTISASSEKAAATLFQRLLNASDTIRLSGVEFQRNRWLYVSQNYRRMLDELFLPHDAGVTPYQSCVILEDDLVLAVDALLYLDAVERLMEQDNSVVTGSLFADNSYPLYARDPQSFRRVSHFAGLGFLLTRRRYVDELRQTVWTGLRNWDEQLQKLVQRRRLVSVVPEVSRALHLRRVTSNSLERLGLSVPRHLFESQLLNKEALPAYNLTHLEGSAYDRYVAGIIQRSQYIKYLTDALFFDSIDETVVYWDCDDDKDLSHILTDRHLWGIGNGGVVRGSYRGTLSFRYFAAQVFIVCKNSEFYSLKQSKKSVFQPETKNFTLDGHGKRRVAGIVHRLTADFEVIVAERDESCRHACDATGNRKCNVTGLWLLNESCDVISHVVPGCRRCASGNTADYSDGALPGIDVENGRCWRSYPHYISCETSSFRYRRLCTCNCGILYYDHR